MIGGASLVPHLARPWLDHVQCCARRSTFPPGGCGAGRVKARGAKGGSDLTQPLIGRKNHELSTTSECARGIPSHVRPSNSRPARFLFTPPHCLKKKATFPRRHCPLRSRTHVRST